MSIPSLYLAIEPRRTETRLMLSTPLGATLKATLPPCPADSRALGLVLDGLAGWYGSPLCAVLDADAADVQAKPGRWARSTVGGLGDFRRAHRLLASARRHR